MRKLSNAPETQTKPAKRLRLDRTQVSLILGFVTVGLVLALGLLGLSQAADAKPRAYVFNEGSGDISIIDTEAQEVIVTVDVGLRIRWFSSRFFDGKRVWAVDADKQKAEVIVFDPWTLKTLKLKTLKRKSRKTSSPWK